MTTTQCSCGFKVETGSAEEGYRLVHQHFLDEINTHVIKTVPQGVHLHIGKVKWYRRIFQGIKKKP